MILISSTESLIWVHSMMIAHVGRPTPRPQSRRKRYRKFFDDGDDDDDEPIGHIRPHPYPTRPTMRPPTGPSYRRPPPTPYPMRSNSTYPRRIPQPYPEPVSMPPLDSLKIKSDTGQPNGFPHSNFARLPDNQSLTRFHLPWIQDDDDDDDYDEDPIQSPILPGRTTYPGDLDGDGIPDDDDDDLDGDGDYYVSRKTWDSILKHFLIQND